MAVWTLTAVQVPLLMAPSAALDVAADPATPGSLNSFTAGDTTGVALKLNQNSRHVENLGRFGSGGWAVAFGLDLTAGSGLTLNISAGIAIIDGVAKYAGGTLALADNTRSHIWISQAGAITARTDLTQPASSAVYLGSVLTAAAAISAVDYSGRVTAYNGVPYRRTADTGTPADSPSAALRYYHETDAGLFVWEGTRYTAVDAQTMLSLSVAGSSNVTLTAAQSRHAILNLTGTLTGNINVVVPTWAGRVWVVVNGTAGAFTLTVKTSAGTGIAVTQGKVAILICDGTNVAVAFTDTVAFGAQPLDAELTAIAGLTSAADKAPYFTGSGAAALADLSSFARTILDDANAAAVQTTLGLVPGTNVQAYDAELAAIAGLTSAADKGIQFTGSGTAATYDLTAAGKALLDDANAAAQRTTLGLGTVAVANQVAADPDDAMPDSTAAYTQANFDALKAEVNDLKAKLRTANVMAT